MAEPPIRIELGLDEFWLLIGALEDTLVVLNRLVAQEKLSVLDVVGPAVSVEYQLNVLYGKLGFDSAGGDENGSDLD